MSLILIVSLIHAISHSHTSHNTERRQKRKFWDCELPYDGSSPSLANTLQYRWTQNKTNIRNESNWSVLHHNLTPGFENVLDDGVNCGLYNAPSIMPLMRRFLLKSYLVSRTLL
jgi:hypothetical protein